MTEPDYRSIRETMPTGNNFTGDVINDGQAEDSPKDEADSSDRVWYTTLKHYFIPRRTNPGKN